ncbi:hypothetical protein D9M71_278860 [compost metagenome]
MATVVGNVTDAGEDDLDILHPERTVTIAGRQVTVREYGFIEGLALRPLMQPFLDDLHVLITTGGVPPLEQILGIIGRHHEIVAQLLATSADVDIDWVQGLAGRPGKQLLYVWWTVTGPFFVGEVVDRVMAERAVDKARAGLTSTPASSPPDTEVSPASGE